MRRERNGSWCVNVAARSSTRGRGVVVDRTRGGQRGVGGGRGGVVPGDEAVCVGHGGFMGGACAGRGVGCCVLQGGLGRVKEHNVT
jgi:hypothetical protein